MNLVQSYWILLLDADNTPQKFTKNISHINQLACGQIITICAAENLCVDSDNKTGKLIHQITKHNFTCSALAYRSLVDENIPNAASELLPPRGMLYDKKSYHQHYIGPLADSQC
nr:hypothetical protein [uncultured Tolumonas sp.]